MNEVLIRKAKKGDKDAFCRLMDENVQSMYKIAAAYLKNDEDVADAIQDTILSCYENLRSISPYGCMLQVFFLLFCYSLTLSFVILVGNLYKGKTKGMIFGLLYSVFGFLLDPKVLAAILHKEKYEMYQVNVLICWISPLNQAVYGKHNLGYDPLLPKISHSYMFFLGILVLLAVFAINRMKKYTFEFLGEKT